jgi:hypothetical protein
VVANITTLRASTVTLAKPALAFFVEVDCVGFVTVAGLDFIPTEAAHANEWFKLTRPLDCFRHLFLALEFYHFGSPVNFSLIYPFLNDRILSDIPITCQGIYL